MDTRQMHAAEFKALLNRIPNPEARNSYRRQILQALSDKERSNILKNMEMAAQRYEKLNIK